MKFIFDNASPKDEATPLPLPPPPPVAAPKGSFKTEAEFFLQAVNTGRLKVEPGDTVVVDGVVRKVIK